MKRFVATQSLPILFREPLIFLRNAKPYRFLTHNDNQSIINYAQNLNVLKSNSLTRSLPLFVLHIAYFYSQHFEENIFGGVWFLVFSIFYFQLFSAL